MIRTKLILGMDLTKISKNEPTGNSLFFYGKSIINENLYMYFYPRIVTNPIAFKRYSGIPRPKKDLVSIQAKLI